MKRFQPHYMCLTLTKYMIVSYFCKLLNLLNVNHSLFLKCGLSSLTAYQSRILRSAYVMYFETLRLTSGILKPIRQLAIIQGKMLNRKSFLTLKAEHRNSYNETNLL
jgi:hypothetical protein